MISLQSQAPSADPRGKKGPASKVPGPSHSLEMPEMTRPSATARGYGTEHQRRRRELLPQFIGTPCAVCGEELRADQSLDLDHSVPLRVDPHSVADRVLHRACNAAWNRSGPPTGFDYSPRPCEVCGTEFKPKLTTQVSCSRACGVVVRRMRRSAA